MSEQYDYLLDGLKDLGCSREEISEAEHLLRNGTADELRKHMKTCRCNLIEEMHEVQKKVDRMDFLIRNLDKSVRKGW